MGELGVKCAKVDSERTEKRKGKVFLLQSNPEGIRLYQHRGGNSREGRAVK